MTATPETLRQYEQSLTRELHRGDIPQHHCLNAQKRSEHMPKPGHYTMFKPPVLQSSSTGLIQKPGVAPLNPSKGP